MVMDLMVELLRKRGLLMPHPIPVPVRQVIRQRSQQGQSVMAIAEVLGLRPRTVRPLLRRFRAGGRDAVAPAYHRPAVVPSPFQDEAVRWRREHATWGAGLI